MWSGQSNNGPFFSNSELDPPGYVKNRIVKKCLLSINNWKLLLHENIVWDYYDELMILHLKIVLLKTYFGGLGPLLFWPLHIIVPEMCTQRNTIGITELNTNLHL